MSGVNFLESRLGEVPRITLPRTPVNKGMKKGRGCYARPSLTSGSRTLSASRLPCLVCLDLTGRHLGRVREQGGQMLRHELSSPEVRLLLGVLVLEDARRNHNPVPGVDEVVSDEARHLADDRDEALIHKLRHLSGLAHALVAPHRNVHSFCLPPLGAALETKAAPNPFLHAQGDTSRRPVQTS